ncbi:sirohydrochlorin chelatase [Nakamurella leprariae]|uniref:Sirohydrochlorin chelatase n=1 Tax=Nakamurella leprariae TaxID=2803911 RepID=A0A938Y5J2_9ACTN|nr:CbiX/SirB N-terminal domain-containing protein [Nakamurella leprariae]MBM9466170.1 hypothetical protein [Nakamurella leprariae]
MSRDPLVLTVAHGTRRADDNRVAARVTELAGHRLGLETRCSYVELAQPLFADVVASLDGRAGGPVVAVPLLLSTGFHVRHDLPAMIGDRAVALGQALGPDALLAAAQVARLVEAGAQPGQPLVMIAAGSNDPAATADLEDASGLLVQAWSGPVRWATLTGLGERPELVVRPGDAVSPYLLAPGFFADRAAGLARDAGATVVADVLGPHPDVVELVVRRATALLDPAA